MRVAQSLIIGSIILSLSACHFQKVKHSPVKATFDAGIFLKSLYFEEDYTRALALADAQLRRVATVDDLKKMVAVIKLERGALKTLGTDSYLMSQGKTMELFYKGEYEKGVLYHRLVLVGDSSSGYKVSGLWFQAEPYPSSPLRRKFDDVIFVFAESTLNWLATMVGTPATKKGPRQFQTYLHQHRHGLAQRLNAMKQSITLTLGMYWEKRLSAAQRRFTRACETLARVRKLSRNVQLYSSI
jgi:hypothetical protein